MIRKILIPVRGDGKGDNVLAHAAALAKRFNAHIVVTYCRARPEDMLPFGVPVPAFMRQQLMEQAVQLANEEEARLQAEFEVLTEKLGLAVGKGNIDGKPSVSWVARAGRQVDIIKQYGRLTDLIAVAQPDRDRNLGANTLKAALFATGRPVMMCPACDTVPEMLGENLTIAWNGSTEASRAVALNVNLIEGAKKVTILTADQEEVHGASSWDLIDYLKLRGIESSMQRIGGKGKISDELLTATAQLGADLMIMGAYSDSHERETVFGGNTQRVVDTAKIPVIMVH